jgi:hypothetical protein
LEVCSPHCLARSKLDRSVARLHLKHDGISAKTRWHFATSTSYDVFRSRRRVDATNFSLCSTKISGTNGYVSNHARASLLVAVDSRICLQRRRATDPPANDHTFGPLISQFSQGLAKKPSDALTTVRLKVRPQEGDDGTNDLNDCFEALLSRLPIAETRSTGAALCRTFRLHAGWRAIYLNRGCHT